VHGTRRGARLGEANVAFAPDSPFRQSHHRIAYLILRGGATKARGACYVDWAVQNSVSGAIRLEMTGVYVDDWRCVDGEWLLIRRELRIGPVSQLGDILPGWPDRL
jgi:hypothetical protein